MIFFSLIIRTYFFVDTGIYYFCNLKKYFLRELSWGKPLVEDNEDVLSIAIQGGKLIPRTFLPSDFLGSVSRPLGAPGFCE